MDLYLYSHNFSGIDYANVFGESTAKLSLNFGGRRFALALDVVWTSTRKPCGLPTTKLSVGCGGDPFSPTWDVCERDVSKGYHSSVSKHLEHDDI